jgi:hypothetical protein
VIPTAKLRPVTRVRTTFWRDHIIFIVAAKKKAKSLPLANSNKGDCAK